MLFVEGANKPVLGISQFATFGKFLSHLRAVARQDQWVKAIRGWRDKNGYQIFRTFMITVFGEPKNEGLGAKLVSVRVGLLFAGS